MIYFLFNLLNGEKFFSYVKNKILKFKGEEKTIAKLFSIKKFITR